MANTFGWVEIRTTDIEKAATFYEDLFGWRVVTKQAAEGSDYWIFDTGDEPRLENLRRGALWLRPDDGSLGIVVYVEVQDIQTTLERVKQLGGKVVAPRTREGSAWKAYFRDPAGITLGLWQEEAAD